MSDMGETETETSEAEFPRRLEEAYRADTSTDSLFIVLQRIEEKLDLLLGKAGISP
jgi:hypothetical protein